MSDLVRKCIHLLVSNRSMNSILTILLDYILQQTNNTHGFIGERKQADTSSTTSAASTTTSTSSTSTSTSTIYRHHAISFPSSTPSPEYSTNGYIDVKVKEHEMYKNVNFGEIYINNNPQSVLPGYSKYNNIICLPLHNVDNCVIGIIGLSGPTDFTKEMAESDLYKHYTEMCAYILQLAIERANISYHKNTFLSNVSHALREPIEGILGVSKLTTNIKLTPVQQQYIDAVTFYSIKLLDMVNDIQDYTKMVSGNLQLINKTMSLQQCLDTIMLITQQKIENVHDVTLTLTTSGILPDTVVADEVRLTQILVNILDNACKFTKKGKIALHVSNLTDIKSQVPLPPLKVKAKSKPQHQLEFTITDTGVGMTSEQVQNIFGCTPYSTTSGVGLGIQIVKYLVEMFGGTVNINSAPGVGTEVKFTLNVGKKIQLTDEQIKQGFDNTQCIFYSEVRNQELIDSLSAYGIQAVYVSSLKEFKKKIPSALKPAKPASKKPGPLNLTLTLTVVIFGKVAKDDKTEVLNSLSAAQLYIINTEKTVIREDDVYYLINSSKDAVADVLTAIINNIKETVNTPAVKHRILIAEDDTASQDLIVSLLRKIGYQDIDMVSDGLEMYLKLTSQEYDMVFVSLTIKVLDAITAVKKYRDAHSSKTAPVIIAVASSITSDIKASCYAAGMNGYVLKPVKATDLAKLDALILKSVP